MWNIHTFTHMYVISAIVENSSITNKSFPPLCLRNMAKPPEFEGPTKTWIKIKFDYPSWHHTKIPPTKVFSHVASKHTSFSGHQTALLPSIHDFNQKFLPKREGKRNTNNITSKTTHTRKTHAKNTHMTWFKKYNQFRISTPNFPYVQYIIFDIIVYFSMERNIFTPPTKPMFFFAPKRRLVSRRGDVVLEIEVFCFRIGRISQPNGWRGAVFWRMGSQLPSLEPGSLEIPNLESTIFRGYVIC